MKLVCLFIQNANVGQSAALFHLVNLNIASLNLNHIDSSGLVAVTGTFALRREEDHSKPSSYCDSNTPLTFDFEQVLCALIFLFAILISFSFMDIDIIHIKRIPTSTKVVPSPSNPVKLLPSAVNTTVSAERGNSGFKRGFLNSKLYSRFPVDKSVKVGKSLQSKSQAVKPVLKEKDDLANLIDLRILAEPVDEGNVSVVFKLKGEDGKPVAMFKPYEEIEYTTSQNKENQGPNGSLTDVKRRLILSSKSNCLNEVCAYKFDQMLSSYARASVPETRYLKLPGKMFAQGSKNSIHGSAQKFIHGAESCGDYGSGIFSTEDVHRIGILDLRILNCDRHSGNLLFNPNSKKLYPIDHALSFPEIELNSKNINESDFVAHGSNKKSLTLKNISFDWMMFHQSNEPFSTECLNAIESIDHVEQLNAMNDLNMSVFQRLAVFAATSILQMAALKFNKTLHDIGEMIQRSGNRSSPSIFEILVSETLDTVDQFKLVQGEEEQIKRFCEEFSNSLERYLKL